MKAILIPTLTVVSLAFSLTLFSQTDTFISGTVVDDAGKPVANAVAGVGGSGTITDTSGHFVIHGTPGTSTLKAEAAGYEFFQQEVTVANGTPLSGLTIALKAATTRASCRRTSAAMRSAQLSATPSVDGEHVAKPLASSWIRP